MRNLFRKSIAGLALASTVALSAAPAEAQRYRRNYHHRGDDAALAIGAGIIGLGLGAAISSNRGYRSGYYGNGYYDRGYYRSGYYNRGYYGRPYYGRGRGYASRCVARRVWDGYYDRWVRVRYC